MSSYLDGIAGAFYLKNLNGPPVYEGVLKRLRFNLINHVCFDFWELLLSCQRVQCIGFGESNN